jgi:hypothetical protein
MVDHFLAVACLPVALAEAAVAVAAAVRAGVGS